MQKQSLKLFHQSGLLETFIHSIRYIHKQDLHYFPTVRLSVQGKALTFLFAPRDSLPRFSVSWVFAMVQDS